MPEQNIHNAVVRLVNSQRPVNLANLKSLISGVPLPQLIKAVQSYKASPETFNRLYQEADNSKEQPTSDPITSLEKRISQLEQQVATLTKSLNIVNDKLSTK